MRPLLIKAIVLTWISLLVSAPVEAQSRFDHERDLSFRLFLGGFDGAENKNALRADRARYTVGLGASSPVALGGRLEANLEIWLTERAYDTSMTPPPLDTASQTMTFTALAMTYGLRLQPASGPFRPYAVADFGFQGSRLRLTGTAAGQASSVEETIITPTVHVGAGVVWIQGRDSFGIDYRRWFTEGEFGNFAIDRAQLGGQFIGLSLGTRW